VVKKTFDQLIIDQKEESNNQWRHEVVQSIGEPRRRRPLPLVQTKKELTLVQ
jgi:hypothetical protein